MKQSRMTVKDSIRRFLKSENDSSDATHTRALLPVIVVGYLATCLLLG
jgi:hypothetical protein